MTYGDDNYLLMVSEIDHDEHFAKVSNRFDDLEIDEITPVLSGLAFQGPKSCEILKTIGFSSIENLKPFEIKKFAFGMNLKSATRRLENGGKKK